MKTKTMLFATAAVATAAFSAGDWFLTMGGDVLAKAAAPAQAGMLFRWLGIQPAAWLAAKSVLLIATGLAVFCVGRRAGLSELGSAFAGALFPAQMRLLGSDCGFFISVSELGSTLSGSSLARLSAVLGATELRLSLAWTTAAIAAFGLRSRNALSFALVGSLGLAGAVLSPSDPVPYLAAAAAGFCLTAAACLERIAAQGAVERTGGAALAIALMTLTTAAVRQRRADDADLIAGRLLDASAAEGQKRDQRQFHGDLLSLPLLRESWPASFERVREGFGAGGYQGSPLVDFFADDQVYADPLGTLAALEALEDQGQPLFLDHLRRSGPGRLRAAAKTSKKLKDEGIVTFQTGDRSGSARRLEASVRVNPDNFYALLSLGTVYSSLGRRERAADCNRRAARLRPDDPKGRALASERRVPARTRDD